MSAARNIHVGTPTDDFPLEESVTVHFHDFNSLTIVKNEAVESPKFTCAGHEWKFVIYPGGHRSSADGMISVYLENESGSELVASAEIALMKSSGGAYKTLVLIEKFFATTGSNTDIWGWREFVSRGKVLDESKNILNKGTLTFVVRIKPYKEYCRRSIVKQSNLVDDIFKLFGEDSTADMAFSVGGRMIFGNSVGGRMFFGHKLILKVRAPELFQLAEQFDLDTPMPINDVNPELFEMMLKHLYGKSISSYYWKKHSKQILLASDKYGFSGLNLEAEAQHILFMTLTAENAVDELLYADGHHCMDLKKAVIEYIVKNGKTVLASSSFPKLAESPELMTEVMRQFAESNGSK